MYNGAVFVCEIFAVRSVMALLSDRSFFLTSFLINLNLVRSIKNINFSTKFSLFVPYFQILLQFFAFYHKFLPVLVQLLLKHICCSSFAAAIPPVDLYLISEKSIWKNQVRRTGFLVYFELDFYCLCSLQKPIVKLIFAG